MAKTGKGLAEFAKKQIGQAYWNGTWGQVANQWLLDYNAGRLRTHYKITRMQRYQQDIKDKKRNAMLSIFCKLIGHETRGGALYYDTQSVLDVHYSFKRCSSTYFFIQKKLNIGIGIILYVREMVNTENGVNNFVDDVETTTRKVFVPRWWFKRYDRYQYSFLTDELKISQDKDTKVGLVSFNPLYTELADKRKKDKKGNKENKEVVSNA